MKARIVWIAIVVVVALAVLMPVTAEAGSSGTSCQYERQVYRVKVFSGYFSFFNYVMPTFEWKVRWVKVCTQTPSWQNAWNPNWGR